MDRQSTIGFVLIGLILMIWLWWSTPQKPIEPPKSKADSAKVVTTKSDSAQKAVKDTIKDTAKVQLPVKSKEGLFSSDTLKEKVFTIENDLAIMEFSTLGGTLKKIYLKKYENYYNDTLRANATVKEKSVQLLNDSSGLSFEFTNQSGERFASNKIKFTSDIKEDFVKIKGKDSLVINFTAKNDSTGAGFNFKYVVHGNRYDIGFKLELEKLKKDISKNQFQLSWRNGLRHVEQYTKDEATYSHASVFYGDENVVFSAEEGKEEKSDGKVGWISVKNKYFTTTLIPDQKLITQGYEFSAKNYSVPSGAKWKIYDATVRFKFDTTSTLNNNFVIFVGPADYNILKEYGNNLTQIVDFGSFFGIKFLVRPIAEFFLLPLFVFLYSFIPNYGIVIIIFSLIIKIILYPLTKNTFQSMKKMQMLQPKIAEIKEKFKDDPSKIQKETMALYSTYGVNPAGGCLPMILQMPIFIALFGTFQTAIQLRGEGFIFWIHDLSRPDVLFNLPFTIPFFGVNEVSGLALLMGVTTFIQQKMTTKDPSQKALVYIMPVFLTILFMTFPSGLNLYYFMFNLFSILQQQYINKYGKQEDLVPIPADKRKKGFMAKLTEAAEKSAGAQQNQKKKKK
jgi:YidC/Oxa1 family membrane protein insertase